MRFPNAMLRTVVLLAPLCLLAGSALTSSQGPPGTAPARLARPDGGPMELYTQHCAACHGERGHGDGPAARFLNPPPRDFTQGHFRIVSTTNGVPSDKDLFETIAAGLPGTAMLGYAHLGSGVVQALVGVVRDFDRQGLRERLGGDDVDEEELGRLVRDASTPGLPLPVGEEPLDDMDSRARGRLHYYALCAACHGPDARGAPMAGKKTSEGYDVLRRDITRGVFKSGWDAHHLFVRIRAGMPGTPMPALARESLDDDGVWDLVHYLGTIVPSGATQLADPVRVRIPVVRVDRPVPLDPDDPRFRAAPEVHVALAPFRADEATVSGLALRAVHDGETIAFRFAWADATWNGPGSLQASPPDGVAARVTRLRQPSVMPMPGLALPLDRALWTALPLPEQESTLYDGTHPRFDNPDGVCRAPLRPQEGGTGRWQNDVWTAVLPIQPMKAGSIESGGTMPASFSVFDGSLRRGPMPMAFSHWHTLLFE